jgi:hypothetical protein
MSGFLFHPITTFVAGAVLALVGLGIYLAKAGGPNTTAGAVADYEAALANPESVAQGSREAVERFSNYLRGIGSKDFIKENTAKVYATNAYLNDTLVTHRGAEAIEAYFAKTAETVTSISVNIDDVVMSGKDFYVRWTMIFSAPALSKGTPVHSVGISQVRFDAEGKVTVHQDFWDSGTNIFAQIPVSGVVIEAIRKRME